MIAGLAIFLVLGLGLIGFGAPLGRRAFVVAVAAPGAMLAWTLSQLGTVLDGGVVTERWGWVDQLDLAVDLRLDGLGATMALIICGIGVLVLLYATSYFGPDSDDLGRLAGLLVLFAGAMVGLVLADHLIALYVFWEITSITSYLLIGNKHTDATARAAALHALLITGGGGLAMLGGFILLGQRAGTYRLSELATDLPTGGAAVTVAVLLVLTGAFTKSAQYPFHAWLPGAMAAPTPVSAYLHSATMVKAGVFLIARLAPVLVAVSVWRPLVIGVGLFTMVASGLRALRQQDLKLLLAYGTVSQLALLTVLFGAGTPELATAGWVLLVGHAVFKAGLFMVVGILDHETGTRDLRELPALDRRRWWPVEVASAVAVLSMAGVPLGLGFVAKEAAYEALGAAPFALSAVVLAGVVAGSMLTAAYAARFHLGTFVLPRRRGSERTGATPSWPFVAPALLLAAVSLAVGTFPGAADRLVTAANTSLGGGTEEVHLALWHGVSAALLLSAVTLLGGALVVVLDRRVQRALTTGAGIPTGGSVYLGLLRGLNVVARRVTGVVQNGSLPVYAGVILTTASLLPAAVFVTRWDGFAWPAVVGPVGTVPIVALLAVAAFGASSMRWRFSAALFLGLAGYAMAGLFVVYGAPDLALTQAAIETLSTVLFVLVLRRLPDKFERQSSPRRRLVRIGVSTLVGATIFVFALAAAGGRTALPVSGEMIERAVPDGHGRNVVNVILVDFRALDTLAEITVLAAASIGAVALARAGRRVVEARAILTGHELEPPKSTPVLPRVVFLDVSAHIIFHAVLMGSLWLLFAGHNQPGGGFVAGLLAGSAISLRFLAGGIDDVRALSRFKPWTVLGSGLVLAGATAAAPLLTGDAVLEVAYRSLDLPLVGDVSLSSALVFDIGVFITVVGMVLMVFEAFGDEPQEVVR